MFSREFLTPLGGPIIRFEPGENVFHDRLLREANPFPIKGSTKGEVIFELLLQDTPRVSDSLAWATTPRHWPKPMRAKPSRSHEPVMITSSPSSRNVRV